MSRFAESRMKMLSRVFDHLFFRVRSEKDFVMFSTAVLNDKKEIAAVDNIAKNIASFINEIEMRRGKPLDMTKRASITALEIANWLNRNIKYGRTVVDKAIEMLASSIVKRPSDVIKSGKGVCRDYSLLAAAIASRAGCHSCVIWMIMEDPHGKVTGHAVTGIRAGEKFLDLYVVDLNSPVMHLEDYLKITERSGYRVSRICFFSLKNFKDQIVVSFSGWLNASKIKDELRKMSMFEEDKEEHRERNTVPA